MTGYIVGRRVHLRREVDPDKALTVAQAAEQLKVSVKRIYKALERNVFPNAERVKPTRYVNGIRQLCPEIWLIPPEDLEGVYIGEDGAVRQNGTKRTGGREPNWLGRKVK